MAKIFKERILITVKTYPVPSTKHIEISCTAGLREDGSWIRLYPIQFRFLDKEKRYKKYQWIEAYISKSSDRRPESYEVRNSDRIEIIGEPLGTSFYWEERRDYVLRKGKVFTNMNEIIDLARSNRISLATFKPSKITDFEYEGIDPELYRKTMLEHERRVAERQSRGYLEGLGDHMNMLEGFKPAIRPDKKFFYIFKDDKGRKARLHIEDWEIFELYRNCKKTHGDSEKAAQEVKKKYFELAREKDLYLFLGTTYEWHSRAPNPFVIVGVFYPPKKPHGEQLSLPLDLE